MVELAYEESPEFGRLIETLAVTGARRSQAARLTVADLQDGRAPRLMMPSSLKGKGVKRIDRKPVPIPASLAASCGRRRAIGSAAALLLLKPDGTAWGASDLRYPFRRVVERAGLDPDVVTSYACGSELDHAAAVAWHPDSRLRGQPRHQYADDRKELQRDHQRPFRRLAPQCSARPGYTRDDKVVTLARKG